MGFGGGRAAAWLGEGFGDEESAERPRRARRQQKGGKGGSSASAAPIAFVSARAAPPQGAEDAEGRAPVEAPAPAVETNEAFRCLVFSQQQQQGEGAPAEKAEAALPSVRVRRPD